MGAMATLPLEAADAPARYSKVAIILHWLMAALILGQLVGGIVMHKLTYSDLKVAMYQWHKTLGLTVLLLAVLRLVWRWMHRPPTLPQGTPAWQKAASHTTHVALYALMIGVPLAGWAYTSATPRGFPTEWFGLPVPDLPVGEGEAQAMLWKDIHKYLAIATIGLLLLHVGAALQHHFQKRDPVLWRMAPWVRKVWEATPPSTKSGSE